ncbi:DoxX family protein [Spirosoma sp. SC4-14]|uniref:DoxX family protein n=1 Tax=Spirosoma sp. SC4-14 TaxID=3128900 RepID=UPI0030CE0815
MMNFFTAAGLFRESGLTLIRIVLGIFLIYHGWEVFDPAQMKEYAAWDTFRQSASPLFMVYLGKGSEFVSGLLLLVGFLTRIGCLIVIGTMLYIVFFIGHGKIFYEDQHPFLFALLALVFFFYGPGPWSLDALFWKNNR